MQEYAVRAVLQLYCLLYCMQYNGHLTRSLVCHEALDCVAAHSAQRLVTASACTWPTPSACCCGAHWLWGCCLPPACHHLFNTAVFHWPRHDVPQR